MFTAYCLKANLMDPQVRTSFIPKKPLTSGGTTRQGLGIISLISLIIFIAALLAAGGVFLYGRLLAQSIASKSTSLERARAAFEPAIIQELIRLDSRLDSGERVLQSHVAPSLIFSLLEEATLQSVRWKSIDYSLEEGNKATIVLDGEARSFSDVALQSDELGRVRALRDVFFDNINLDQAGRAVFTMRASVDLSFLLYKNALQAAASSPAESPTP